MVVFLPATTCSPLDREKILCAGSTSRRVSTTSNTSGSTTKSALRSTNAILLETVQNVQNELQVHRSLMSDIENRIAKLEPRVSGLEENCPRAGTGLRNSYRNSIGLKWMQACENFARNSECNFNPEDFVRSQPAYLPHSSLARASGLSTPPATPPDSSDTDVIEYKRDEEPQSSSKKSTPISLDEISSPRNATVVEVEANEKPVLVPILNRPPTPPPKSAARMLSMSSKSSMAGKSNVSSATTMSSTAKGEASSIEQGSAEVVEALPEFVNPPPSSSSHKERKSNDGTTSPGRRFLRGRKSLATFEAKLKNLKSDKSNVVLIRFHRAKDLKKEN